MSTILVWRSLVKAIEHKDIVHILKVYIIVIIFFTFLNVMYLIAYQSVMFQPPSVGGFMSAKHSKGSVEVW